MSELYNSNNTTIYCVCGCIFVEEKKNMHMYQRESLEFETLNINSGRKCADEDFGPSSVWGPTTKKKKNKNKTNTGTTQTPKPNVLPLPRSFRGSCGLLWDPPIHEIL